MAFNFEFPNANYYDADLREVIRLYKELSERYDTLVSDIKKLTERLDVLEKTIQQTIKDQINLHMSIMYNRLKEAESDIAELERTVAKQGDAIVKLNADIEAKYRELITMINDKFQTIYDQYNDLLSLLHEYKKNISEYVDERFEDVKKQLEDELVKIERLAVVNPYNDQIQDIQDVLNMIVDRQKRFYGAYGITAKDYDDFHITAWEYEQLMISAIDYDMRAYIILFLKLWKKRFLVRNPFTGQMVTIQEMFNELAHFHMNGITAGEYDFKGYNTEAGTYDSLNVTGEEYDTDGKRIFT